MIANFEQRLLLEVRRTKLRLLLLGLVTVALPWPHVLFQTPAYTRWASAFAMLICFVALLANMASLKRDRSLLRTIGNTRG